MSYIYNRLRVMDKRQWARGNGLEGRDEREKREEIFAILEDILFLSIPLTMTC
jgi:hypothetical protein